MHVSASSVLINIVSMSAIKNMAVVLISDVNGKFKVPPEDNK
jgi:hypothetical protein